MTILELYRGDSSKIKEFDFDKTNKHCLFGQGIYLTNNKKIAESYREKGNYVNEDNNTLAFIRGSATPVKKEVILKQAFEKFIEIHWNEKFNYPIKKNSDVYKRLVSDLHDKWYFALQDQIVKVEQNSHYTFIKGNERTYSAKVIWIRNIIGYITTFHFDEQYVSNNVINIDSSQHDESFLGLVYDNNIDIFTSYNTRESFIRNNRSSVINCNIHTKNWIKLRHLLEPYGIIGLEYHGGRRLGGGYHHRAFVLWDDEFVNNHKVSRIK